MSEPFVGEIRLFAGTFAPQGWASCDGQLLSVSEYETLFTLLGTTYGGDGRTTFALPDLRGRVPIHVGQGPGLSARQLGQQGGEEHVTLTPAQMPSHGHPAVATNDTDVTTTPAGNVLGHPAVNTYRNPLAAPTLTMADQSVAAAGGGQSHDNLQPFQVVRFIIALYGIYPSRQ